MSAAEIKHTLEAQIKSCIHCGMCLPACPTYNVTLNEANSPRGRIYLINDLLTGKLDEADSKIEKQAIDYLDNCLTCYACETVCPSNVEYADILHYARSDMKLTKYNKGFFAFIRKIFFVNFINNRFLLRMIRVFMKLTSFLVKPVMYVFGFKNQAKLIPKFKKTYKALDEGEVYYSDLKLDTPDEKRIVNFSLGCVMDTIYNHVHWDCVQVLNAFGYHVQISESNCCGSLASHSGEEKIAQKLKEKFFKKIKEESLPLVTNSAGCGAFIKEAQGELNLGVYDFIELLKNAPFNPLKDKSFKAEILYHPACHLNHRQGVSNLYEELLEDVQGLQVVTLDSKDTCCGSAGFYNLIRSEMAAKIGKDKIAEIIQREVKTLVTANPGCMSQIAAYLPEDFIVLHPASFIKKILFGRMP